MYGVESKGEGRKEDTSRRDGRKENRKGLSLEKMEGRKENRKKLNLEKMQGRRVERGYV